MASEVQTLEHELLSGGLRVAPTEDYAYLKSLFEQPEIYDRVADDSSMPREAIELDALRGLRALVLLVSKDSVAVGCFLLLPHQTASGLNIAEKTYEVHTVLSEACRGRHAWRAGRLGIQWMFTETDCAKLVSRCPEDNPQSLVFAMCQGFHICERKRDWLKRGQLLYSNHVELTREQWQPRPAPMMEKGKENLCQH